MAKIGGAFNIPRGIVAEAERLGLDAMATGGGLDYIYKPLGKNEDGSERVVILGDAEDAGSPDSLNSNAELHIIVNEDWTQQVSILFKTAKEALRVMTAMYNPHST